MTTNPAADEAITSAAREALTRGFIPVPIRKGSKAPAGAGWTHQKYEDDAAVEATFSEVESLGLILGEASGGLVDVDLDHVIAWRLAKTFLPPTAMRTGRVGNPSSHYWYKVTDEIPGYRKYTLPDNSTVTVELRSSSGHQTLIPPSVWYPKKGVKGAPEDYRWEGEPWGGEDGPTEITGRQLAVRVASLALATILVENWPHEGSRHDAYLALAGGMLRFGSEGVHPYWERALPQLIEALAEATHDDEDGKSRVAEVVPTTKTALENGRKAQGWPALEKIIGEGSVAKARVLVREIESIVDWKRHLPLPSTNQPLIQERYDDGGGEGDPQAVAPLPDDGAVNPLDDRADSWEPVNMEPYLAGEVTVPEPTILRRTDGAGLFYPGRVNSLFGKSESAKSWVAMQACLQEIGVGERVIYIDLEDDPAMTLLRMRLMGAGDDDIRYQFTYIRPEGPHLTMQRDTWGNEKPTEIGRKNAQALATAIGRTDPGLVVVDGMSVLYGLHGLNTNDVTSTDVITNWLKSLTRNGRTTVIVIDHTHKGAEKGSGPIGSQHKISMVQGTAIQVVPVTSPRPGILGHVELVVGKDRPGGVRAVSSDEKHQVAADVFIDSRVEGKTVMTIKPPTAGDTTIAPTDSQDEKLTLVGTIAKHVLDAFRNHPGVSLSSGAIDAAIAYNGYSAASLKRAIDSLVADGFLEAEGETRGRTYRLIDGTV